MTDRFFYTEANGYGSIIFVDSLEKAIEGAKRNLGFEREDAQEVGGWSDLVEEICYGKIYGAVEQTYTESAPDDSDFDEFVDYELIDYVGENQ